MSKGKYFLQTSALAVIGGVLGGVIGYLLFIDLIGPLLGFGYDVLVVIIGLPLSVLIGIACGLAFSSWLSTRARSLSDVDDVIKPAG